MPAKLLPEHITLDGCEYVLGRLDMFQSLNLTRLVSPLLPVLFSDVFGNALKTLFASKELKEASLEDVIAEINLIVSISEPVLVRFAQLPTLLPRAVFAQACSQQEAVPAIRRSAD